MQRTDTRYEVPDQGCLRRTLEVHGWVVTGGADLRARTYPGGPTIVRDVDAIVSAEGRSVPVDRPTVAICRCGKSRLAPACDGTHRAVRDLADVGPVPLTLGRARS